MRHPFAGVIAPERKTTDQPAEQVKSSRRGFFGLVAGTLAAATCGLLGSGSEAEAQRATTLALGEEGGRRATTRALGEEGGRVSTRAFGEEGGGRRPTTLALGEEGGRGPSTRMFGEEGGGRRRGLKK